MTTPTTPLITPSTPPLFPPASHLCSIRCEVGSLVSLGPAPLGERRYVPLLGGDITGEHLQGRIVPGGVDWQIARRDGVLEIDAHYVMELSDGALVEVESRGLRHGPADVMRRLAAGEPVAPTEYFFRTAIRFTTGAPAWAHLNTVLAVGVGNRQAGCVLIEVFRLS